MRKLVPQLVLVVLLVSPTLSRAETDYWWGIQGGNWADSTAWSLGRIPNGSDTVCLNLGGNASLVSSGSAGMIFLNCGTLALSGTGQLDVYGPLTLGWGAFVQSSGTATTTFLNIGTLGLCQLGGGRLEAGSLAVAGTLDFLSGDATVVVAPNSIVDLSIGTVLNSGNASFTIGPNSLLMVGTRFDPANSFSIYSNGGMTHVVGTPLSIPSGTRFGGQGTIPDLVDCQGTILAGNGGGISLSGGVSVSGTGSVDLGSGSVTFAGTHSQLRDSGVLGAQTGYIGSPAGSLLTQTAGNLLFRGNLFIASGVGTTGTYQMDGGTLTVSGTTYIGCDPPGSGGVGTFTQAGGSHSAQALRLDRGTYQPVEKGRCFRMNIMPRRVTMFSVPKRPQDL